MATELGSDLAGVGDITWSLDESTGEQHLAEAIAERWLASWSFDDQEYGVDLIGYLDSTEIPKALATRMAAAARLDERVRQCDVAITRSGSTVTVKARIYPYRSKDFEFTLTADQVTAALLLETEA